jgi:hypothetical protein
MRRPKIPNVILLALALTAIALLSACSVNKQGEGNNEKVDIKSPFGNIKVNKQATAADTGLPVYAGARIMPNEKGNDSTANVNIDSPYGGVKVIVAKYESDDAQEKVLTFYRDQLKKSFGTVVECHGESGESVNPKDEDDDTDRPVSCGNQDTTSKTVQLKTGTTHKQHIVVVKPRSNGSEIDLVYVKLRGKDDSI